MITPKLPEHLHSFSIIAFEFDTAESIYEQAGIVATHEDKQQVSLAVWSENWVIVHAKVEGNEHFFEIHGTFKYFTQPEYIL